MKSKLIFAAGMGVGYVLGTRAGRGSYEKIKATVRSLWNKDVVQDTVSDVQETIKGQAGQAVHTLVEQVLPSRHTDSDAGPTSSAADKAVSAARATPPDIVPEASDEFPDAALKGGEGQNW